MNIYFFTAKPSIENTPNIMIISSLQKARAKVFSNLEGLTNPLALSTEIDGIVILGDGEARDLAYILALGIARNKPILYLQPKGKSLPPEITKVRQSKDLKKILTIACFTRAKLRMIVRDFIEKGPVSADKCRIKFTLRLNNSLDSYLHWKSKRIKKTKAVLARRILEQYKNNDQYYNR